MSVNASMVVNRYNKLCVHGALRDPPIVSYLVYKTISSITVPLARQLLPRWRTTVIESLMTLRLGEETIKPRDITPHTQSPTPPTLMHVLRVTGNHFDSQAVTLDKCASVKVVL